jgi:TRAP-type C4-dicarboxylate transport system substrate-binding protein
VGVAGYGCVGVGMGHAGFLGKWGGEREEKNSGKQRFKIFFFPASACAGKKNLHRAVQNGTVQFFFLFFFGFKKKKKKIWK